MRKYHLYTDGSCRGNPGSGGWAFILLDESLTEIQRKFGSQYRTTNNRMEMQALIDGLLALGTSRARVLVHSDSRYLIDGSTKWIRGWKKNNFKNGTIKNSDLWIYIDNLLENHDVSFEWVKGHANDTLNEECDRMAQEASGKVENLYKNPYSGKFGPASEVRKIQITEDEIEKALEISKKAKRF